MKLATLSLIFIFVLQNVFAQQPVSAYDQDTILNSKVIPLDPHLVFPVLKHPLKFCDSMETTFKEYILSHVEIAAKFDFMNDSNNYYVSISFDISKAGKVFNLKQRKNYSQIDSFCNEVFAPLLRRTQWKHFYKRNQKSNNYLDTKAIMSFELNKGKISFLHIRELMTWNQFFECIK